MMMTNRYVMIKVIVVNKYSYCWVFLLIVIFFSASSVSAAELLPPPPNSTIASVSRDSSILGINMSIRRFDSRLSAEQVIEFYSKRWTNTAAITHFSPWQMIGKAERKKYLNVQVQTGPSGSWGYLSISDLPERLAKNDFELPDGKNFPKMSGSKVLSDQQQRDDIKDARTLVLSNGFSVDSNSQFYRQHYKSQGWQLVADSKGSKMKGAAMTFSRGRSLLSLTINRLDSITSVVANIETAKLF